MTSGREPLTADDVQSEVDNNSQRIDQLESRLDALEEPTKTAEAS